MNEKLIQKEGFSIVGIKTRTSNHDEMNGAGKIASLWNRFYAENISAKIPHRLGGKVFGVYYGYESDASGPYDLMVGMEVPQDSLVPEGLEVIQIPGQRYLVVECEKGLMPDIVIQAWQKIWSLEKNNEIRRKYSFDLEVYPENSEDRVKILIAAGDL